MLRPVVVFLIFLQHTAEQHAACDEQKICADDDEDHSHEEPYDRIKRVGDAHGKVIRRGEDHDARKAEQPVCLRRLFADGLAAQQRHGAAAPDADDRGEPDDREDDGVQSQRARQGISVNADAVIDIAAEHIDQSKLRELREDDAERETEHEREHGGNEALPGNDARKIALIHAEDVIESEFPLAAADKERIGIVEKDRGEHKDHKAAEIEDQSGAVGAARQQRARLRRAEEREDIEHHHHAHAGEQIRGKKPLVLAQAVPRETRIESGFHRASPPPASIVSVSEMRW